MRATLLSPMPSREHKTIAALSGSTLALAFTCAFLLLHGRGPVLPSDVDLQAALARPEVRDEVIRRLTRTTVQVFDTHNDPQVGRVLQPNLESAVATGVPFQTNALGLRERAIALPKPEGTLRIVLLGDSFIMGYGVEQQDRVGVFLERYLRERSQYRMGEIECLHVGIGSWDVEAECAYLRRMLSDLRPDLVIHVLVSNDLDDLVGVRGFGGLASFGPRKWAQTDALVSLSYPARFSGPMNTNYLLGGLDFESRHRYEAMVADLEHLAARVRASGARYLIVGHWGGLNGWLWQALEPRFRPEDCILLPNSWRQGDFVLSDADPHWSPEGHDRLARLLYGVIHQRNLLPELSLPEWPEAVELATRELDRGWEETLAPGARPWKGPDDVSSRLEPASFSAADWRQVYTGLDAEGMVSPFASFMLRARRARSVRVRGKGLDRPEMAGARLTVSIEGLAAGELELEPGLPFEASFAIPAAARGSPFVNVRLEASDYVYARPDRQHCISYRLELLALEP